MSQFNRAAAHGSVDLHCKSSDATLIDFKHSYSPVTKLRTSKTEERHCCPGTWLGDRVCTRDSDTESNPPGTQNCRFLPEITKPPTSNSEGSRSSFGSRRHWEDCLTGDINRAQSERGKGSSGGSNWCLGRDSENAVVQTELLRLDRQCFEWALIRFSWTETEGRFTQTKHNLATYT